MRFKAKIWKAGDSNVVTIPSDYVNTGEFKLGEVVNVEVTKEAVPDAS